MLTFTLRRIGLGIVILLVTMLMLFSMIHVIPGDPAVIALGPHATPEMRAAFREAMGLDLPLPIQFGRFIACVLTGDLGTDMWSQRPVGRMIGDVLPDTLVLAFASLFWSVALGVALGCLAVIHRDRWPDWLIGTLSVSFIAVPTFLIGIYALLIFAVFLNWLPAIGAGEPGDPGSQIAALILPSFAVGIGWVGYIARIVRASMLEVIADNHVRTLRAYGVPRRRIIFKYALRLAIQSAISVIAIGFGTLLSSAVYAEIVFSRPGIGLLTYQAVSARNYPVVLGTVLVTAALYVGCMIMADLLLARLDPRARASL
jgi:ABC-type dipeptide/oligopeptide/nickel transport system permease component